MTEEKFSAHMRQEGDYAILDLEGDINAFAENTLEEAYDGAEAANPSTIALNFNDVDYINSTGIALIVSLLAQARKSQVDVVVYGLSEHYREIFNITRLSDFMSMYDDEESALTD